MTVNGNVSVMEIRHPSLYGKKIRTIILLQTGAKEGRKVHRSHYDVLFPLTVLDDKDVSDLDDSTLQSLIARFTHSENAYMMFSLVSRKNPLLLKKIEPKRYAPHMPYAEKRDFLQQPHPRV